MPIGFVVVFGKHSLIQAVKGMEYLSILGRDKEGKN